MVYCDCTIASLFNPSSTSSLQEFNRLIFHSIYVSELLSVNLIYFDLFQDTEFHLHDFSKNDVGRGKLYSTYRHSVVCDEK